jgi:hypothetical protein
MRGAGTAEGGDAGFVKGVAGVGDAGGNAEAVAGQSRGR